MKDKKRFSIVLLFVLALVFVACTPEPVYVYVTPTPQVPTATATNTATLAPLPATPTITTDPNTAAATVAAAPTEAPIIIGAVVGPDYTLQPSNTPIPTQTATVPPLPTQPPPTAGPSPTPPPGLDPSQVGLQLYWNMGLPEWKNTLNRAKEVGVTWIKMQVSWSFVQPDGRDPNQEQLKRLELFVETADQAGYQILLSVAKAPGWARGSGQADSPPANPATFADFLTIMLTTTKIGGIVDAIEVWNEPNLREREWNTDELPFNGAGYMQLFRPAYDAIRAVRGDIVIVTAGLAPAGAQANIAIDDREYLRQMFANGLAEYTQSDSNVAIGVHPYGWGNPPDARCCDPFTDQGWDESPQFFFLDTLEDYREIINANGSQSTELWPTEFGWATWTFAEAEVPDPWMLYNTPQEQADFALRAIEIGQKELTGIGPMFLWNLNFANPLTIVNGNEITAYSILLPPAEAGQPEQRRPLYYLLPQSFQNAPTPQGQ